MPLELALYGRNFDVPMTFHDHASQRNFIRRESQHSVWCQITSMLRYLNAPTCICGNLS